MVPDSDTPGASAAFVVFQTAHYFHFYILSITIKASQKSVFALTHTLMPLIDILRASQFGTH